MTKWSLVINFKNVEFKMTIRSKFKELYLHKRRRKLFCALCKWNVIVKNHICHGQVISYEILAQSQQIINPNIPTLLTIYCYFTGRLGEVEIFGPKKLLYLGCPRLFLAIEPTEGSEIGFEGKKSRGHLMK